MAIGRWGELSGLLNKALKEVPAERLQGGPGGGSPTKAAVKAERTPTSRPSSPSVSNASIYASVALREISLRTAALCNGVL